MYRALIYTPTTAYTAKHSIVVGGEINKLVHKPLTEALHLRGTGCAVRHHCEVVIHTGVPATVTLYAIALIEVAHVVALAGRAHKCTSAATDAGVLVDGQLG